jgi:hypothetical protein
MPQRNERLFWLTGKGIENNIAQEISHSNDEFIKSWNHCVIETFECVKSNKKIDRCWLFVLATKDQGLATKFNKTLSNHIKKLNNQFPSIKIKRQVALPTPLLLDRVGNWPKTDIGLHVVNDNYNGMMVTYSYHEGKNYNIPHLEFIRLQELYDNIKDSWGKLKCDCHLAKNHCALGCYECFKIDCEQCQGTGWKDFVKWRKNGYLVDYSKGIPLAIY